MKYYNVIELNAGKMLEGPTTTYTEARIIADKLNATEYAKRTGRKYDIVLLAPSEAYNTDCVAYEAGYAIEKPQPEAYLC